MDRRWIDEKANGLKECEGRMERNMNKGWLSERRRVRDGGDKEGNE